MLFNTLGYALFFALVFVVSWALVDRRYAVFLPWLPLAGFTAVRLHGASLADLGRHANVLGAAVLGLVASVFFFLRASRLVGTSRGAAPLGTSRAAAPLGATPGATSATLDTARISSRAVGRDDVFPLSPVALVVLSVIQFALLSSVTFPFSATVVFLGPFGIPVDHLTVTLSWILFFVLGVFLVRAKKVRLLFLLGASYVFYAHWDYRFLPLIWASSTADYFLAKAIDASPDARRRKLWLVFTVVMNLGVLGFFKYWDFGVATAAAALNRLGVEASPRLLGLALPVGISFFTFESMSYVIDVYRRELEPQKSYSEYLAFVAFFPHLVAGPIVRPRDLLPQLTGPARFNPLEGSEGLFLIAVGLGKKILIGDYLAVGLVDRVFDAPAMYSGLEVYAAVIGYAVVIYCDFSGYTDIAIGSALLLGIRFPLNFDSPYKAVDIQDFWRRWHISLSTWLRDYLYIPLGGNRKGPVRTYLNLLATMILGGLWHGASFTFVIWGALHGAALAVNRAWSNWRAARHRRASEASASPLSREEKPNVLGRIVGVFLTFHFVCIAWVFFRAETFDGALLVFRRIASLTLHHPNLHRPLVLVLALGLVGHFVPNRLFEQAKQLFCRSPGLVQGLVLFLVALLLRRFTSMDDVPFVYFQF